MAINLRKFNSWLKKGSAKYSWKLKTPFVYYTHVTHHCCSDFLHQQLPSFSDFTERIQLFSEQTVKLGL